MTKINAAQYEVFQIGRAINFTLISVNSKLQDCPTCRCSALTEILKSKKKIFLFPFFWRIFKVKTL